MSRRILIIDNEQYIREVAQVCLETVQNWKALTAGSGLEGIEIAETHQPDAILLDVMMPGIDGLTTYQKLQDNSKTRHIPVILLTAKVQASDRRRYSDLGIRAVIAKPFNPLQLAEHVAQALGWPRDSV